jgi:hypothetical protein
MQARPGTLGALSVLIESEPKLQILVLTRFLPQISLRNLRKLDCDANWYPLRSKTLQMLAADVRLPECDDIRSSEQQRLAEQCRSNAACVLSLDLLSLKCFLSLFLSVGP